VTPAARWTLVVVCAATAILLLDVTVVNVALAQIERDLGASFDELQWVIDAYAIALAAVLLVFGSLADRIGRRRVLVAGLVVFAGASLVCALAPDPVVLDVGRGIQGVGAAAMFATSLALLAQEFEQGERRGFAFGVWGAVSGAAIALGPLVGGALVDALDWEWIFLVNLPIAAALIALALARVPESKPGRREPLDLAGAVTFAAALLLIVLGLTRGNSEGWADALIVGALAGGAALLALFVVLELRRPRPMLDVRLFRDGAFAGTAAVAFLQSVAIYPLFLFMSLWLQDVLGYDPFETGLRLLPFTLLLFAVAPLAGKLTARRPLGELLGAGLVLLAAGLMMMRGLDARSDWDDALAGMLVSGAGVGLISPALAAAMVGVLPRERSGLASGINNTFRQTGIAAGIAGLGAIFQRHDPDQAGFAAGLNDVFLVAAGTAALGAVAAMLLIRVRA
jgi:EmrB/QacA subfamily drug resistance transporter